MRKNKEVLKYIASLIALVIISSGIIIGVNYANDQKKEATIKEAMKNFRSGMQVEEEIEMLRKAAETAEDKDAMERINILQSKLKNAETIEEVCLYYDEMQIIGEELAEELKQLEEKYQKMLRKE